jgi:hypothetical protein
MTTTRADAVPSLGHKMINKVPEVTLFFWVIKIMCTTVGETAADYLNVNLGFGLTNTTYFTGAALAVLLLVQFQLKRYVPLVYWSVVVVISVFGTLITDNLTDAHNVPLLTSTIVFSVILAAVFAIWYAVERTLSIHSIITSRREAFYWLAILFTFALGTAAGVLAGLHLDPAARRVDRRRDVTAQPQVRRPWPRHHRHVLHLPRLHPGAGQLSHHHQEGPNPASARPGRRAEPLRRRDLNTYGHVAVAPAQPPLRRA